MLLLGGSAVINALTGMNIYAATFLIPIGVIMYTAIGGLKATFMSSYVHTVRPQPECHYRASIQRGFRPLSVHQRAQPALVLSDTAYRVSVGCKALRCALV